MSAPRQYEIVYLVSPDATEQEVADLHGQVEAIVSRFGGHIEKTENWGRRRLAYEIEHHKEATYVLEQVVASGELVKEIDRRLRVTDSVIRHLIVRVDEEMRVAERARAERAAAQAKRQAARGITAEGAEATAPVEAPAGGDAAIERGEV